MKTLIAVFQNTVRSTLQLLCRQKIAPVTLQANIIRNVVAVFYLRYLTKTGYLVDSVIFLAVAAIPIIVEALCTVSLLARFTRLYTSGSVMVYIHALFALETSRFLDTYEAVLYCAVLCFFSGGVDFLANATVFCWGT